jgi:integrase
MPKPNCGPRLEPNERGIYEIRWTENGRSKRRSTRTSDIAFAQKVLGAFLTLEEQQQRIVAAEAPLLVMDVLGDPDADDGEDYWHEHVLPNCVDKERPKYDLAKLHKHFGAMAVKDIAPADVRAYAKARRTGKLGRPSVNHTISRELATLNAAIVHAVKERRLAPGDKPFIELQGTSPPRDRWLDHGEAERLIAAAAERVDPHAPKERPTRVLRFTMLALETASRKTALLELKRKQVDLAHGLIYLNPHGRQQTNKRRPPVPISSKLRPILEQTLNDLPDDPEAYVLDHPGCIRTAFENCVERAGLSRDVTPHVLRHTKATWMAQARRDMWEIAGLLGDSIATVTKTYAHHHPDYLRDAVEARPTPQLRVVGGKG